MTLLIAILSFILGNITGMVLLALVCINNINGRTIDMTKKQMAKYLRCSASDGHLGECKKCKYGIRESESHDWYLCDVDRIMEDAADMLGTQDYEEDDGK